MQSKFIAHYRDFDQKEQSVVDHLRGVSDICQRLAGKIGMPDLGLILGLLHDFGKYSQQFQSYIQSATGILDPDIDDSYVNANDLKGKIDHSTAGAQWIWQRCNKNFIGQILAVCLVSHHGGLLDCLQVDGKNGFIKRIDKDDVKTHLQECITASDTQVISEIEQIISGSFFLDFDRQLKEIYKLGLKEPDHIKHFRLGFFTRFLFGCLIDADRIDSADFGNPINRKLRPIKPIDWQIGINRMEKKVTSFSVRNHIDTIRNDISNQCQKRAKEAQNIYTLTVPTGGGKTFASMRYALHHAKEHKLDHIIYIIPFTSIIEQNAEEIRLVIEKDGDAFPWVLEHHSNLEPEEQTQQSKLVAENWDAPIIFTTMVQFLEVLFGGGTRGARRMHSLANSVLIFDEIQSLPINCVHLFCNGLQFLVDYARTSAILCTATQPLLNNLNPEYSQLRMPDNHELVDNKAELFTQLKRVGIVNKVCPQGWTEIDLTKLAIQQLEEKGNCLIIVNTKKWAQKLYELCQNGVDDHSIFHLSTSLCPAHRKKILTLVRQRLDAGLPVLCISTQLIEAGVDVDFNSVIRFLAGLDSIAQAAGRCNRNGNLSMAQVFVVNPQDEAIDMLDDIKEGRDKALRIFSENKDGNLLNPDVMNQYFSYYFYDRAQLMTYPLTEKQAGRQDTLLSLLSDNSRNVGRSKQGINLQQSFKTAGRAFKAIDAPTQAVIVPYGKGRDIIGELCADFEPAKAWKLIKQAQQYSVNVFPNAWRKLQDADAVTSIQGEEIYFLDERFYSNDFGLATEIVSNMDTPIA
ncbi:MAG: CRISPR-associated helicase Cas3' [Desulfobacterales bacterium]|nr:CRISPR-associated helicase Cas3' [Desulfobacterales bacterium]